MTVAVERPEGPARHDSIETTTTTNQTVSSASVPASLVSSDMLNGHAPIVGQSMARSAGDSLPSLADGDAKCGGCSEVIDQEHGGTVVAFGSSLWHVDCFRCAKCKERVSADTNLLLLSDGSPVCGNCSYQCFVCKQAITEEAIMTGDESYHAHCFTCRTCKRRIEELVFAKTSQGIYCMACHNERVARSRRHAEAKRQRAARKEKEQREKAQLPRDGGALSETPLSGQFSSSNLAPQSQPLSPVGSPATTPTNPSHPFTNAASPGYSDKSESSDPTRSRDISLDGRLPRSISPGPKVAEPPPPPLPTSPSEPNYTRQKTGESSSSPRSKTNPTNSPQIVASPSMGSTAPLNIGNKSPNAGLGVGPVGLSVPTSRAEKRRSINPAMSFNMDAANGTFAVEPRLSPLPPSPLRTSFSDLQAEQKGAKGPSSPSPTVGTTSFPFPHPAPAPAGVTPSRSDSGLDSVEQHGPTSRPQVGSHDKPSDDAESTPRLNAPDLPPMSFSLSDPDFASILNDMDKTSPRDATASKTGVSGVHGLPKTSTSQSSFMTKSPQMDHLASAAAAVDGDAAAPSSAMTVQSLSSSSSRLGPPPTLRSRQTSAESTTSLVSRFNTDSALYSLVELVAAAKHSNNDKVQIDLMLLANIVNETEDLKDQISGLRSKYTGAKRTSQQYSEGLTVAGEEYDKEVAMRRELEAEVTRLKAQVHTQTARLSVISGDERRQESMKRRSQDLASSLSGLERDISRLRAQRDMTIAEVEELHARRNSPEPGSEATANAVGQSLTTRLDTIKEQYREELEPLTAQREALQREIAELRETREQCLEESTALTAKNEELAELNAQLTRQNEMLQDTLARGRAPTIFSKRSHPTGSPSMSSLATSGTLQEVPEETARVVKVSKPEPIEAAPARRFKWGIKSSKGPDMSGVSASISKPLGLPTSGNRNPQRPSTEFGMREHSFQQYSTMRLTRCEMCQEKMWGLQEVRCSQCGTICHSKCAEKLPGSCTGTKNPSAIIEEAPAGPSMFGRELSEQAASDAVAVPVIITKCIYAVEAVGMEYEGIYRKSGGSSQSKQITQLFEKGDYDSFDLADIEVFNDISSVTSVLKNYFRQLPNPLLTHALHESFVTAACIPNVQNKNAAMRFAIEKLPKDHYNTLRTLMLHLHRVTQHASVNLMTSQNLGVVFGPTLMRSADPGREFGDMAGKALSVQWMVENAPSVFAEAQ